VERLLGMGADPRHLNREGRDALIVSSAKGFAEIARMLLGRGADFNARDNEGWSALTIAAYNGHEDLVSLLGASVLSKDLDEALLVASFNGDTRVISTLLSQGADINSRSPEGKTPLMIAAESGKSHAVRVLLQHQANPYSEVEEGINAGVLAARAGHEDIQRLIADPDSWGRSDSADLIIAEKSEAQQALLTSTAVEETIHPFAPGATSQGGSAEDSGADSVAGTDPVETDAGDLGPALASHAPEAAAASSSTGADPPSEGGTGDRATRPQRTDAASAPAAAGSDDRQSVAISPAAAAPAAASSAATPVAATPTAASPANSPVAQPLSPQDRARIREEAASKPVVAMNGSTIRSTSPSIAPVRSMVLASFHEEPVPLRVTQVESERAEVKRIDLPDAPPVAAVPGQLIPGTNYEVLGLERRFVSSKEGQGRMVDVSRVKVHNRETGATHLLVKDVSGQSSDTYAILTAPQSQYRYVVKAGDVFRSAQHGASERDYQVLDIRASGVVVKDLLTAEVLTIARDGVQ